MKILEKKYAQKVLNVSFAIFNCEFNMCHLLECLAPRGIIKIFKIEIFRNGLVDKVEVHCNVTTLAQSQTNYIN
jgi:hypothetical protein